jgi:excisionase family DNA binding protein
MTRATTAPLAEALGELLDVPAQLRELRAQVERLAAAQPAQEPATAPVAVYLSTEEAGRICEVTPATVRSWVKAGHLKAYHAGRLLRVKRAELEAFLARQPAAGNGDGAADQDDDDDLAAFVSRTRGRRR